MTSTQMKNDKGDRVRFVIDAEIDVSGQNYDRVGKISFDVDIFNITKQDDVADYQGITLKRLKSILEKYQ